MADLKDLTPYLLGLMATALAWLFKSAIQMGKDITRIQTALEFYFENRSKGAAMVLDSPNPTPPEMRVLLKKYYSGTATKPDVEALKEWLTEMIEDPQVKKSERSAAIDILASLGAMKIMDRGRPHLWKL